MSIDDLAGGSDVTSDDADRTLPAAREVVAAKEESCRVGLCGETGSKLADGGESGVRPPQSLSPKRQTSRFSDDAP
jgi:hypothetical protein